MGGMDRLSIMLQPAASLHVRADGQLLMNHTLTMSSVGEKDKPNQLHESFSTGIFAVNKVSVLSTNATPTSAPAPAPTPTSLLGTITSVFSSSSTNNKTSGGKRSPFSDSDSDSDSDENDEYMESPTATTSASNLSIFSIIPGKIQTLVLAEQDEWCLHHHAFLACSENITIETAVSFKLSIQGNGTHVTKVRNLSNQPGLVWIISYGGIMEHSLEDNQFSVHSGLFLATKSANYDKAHIQYMGNRFDGIAGGEMMMMDFSKTEPAPGDKLYIQTGNIDEYLHFMSKSMPKNENSRMGNDMGYKKESPTPPPPPSMIETPFPVTSSTNMGSPMKSSVEGPIHIRPQKGGESRKRTTRRKSARVWI
jgi:uncharacterized protein (AIM24 family)